MTDSSVPPQSGSSVQAAHLATLGHDLRAAVADVLGGLRLIDADTLSADVQLQLERIRSSGEALARLIEEGLSVMMGEPGLLAGAATNIQTARLLHDLQMRWSGRAAESGLDFALFTDHDIPAVIQTDRVALERILSNILSNAIKYTETGSVLMSVECDANRSITFSVSDSGPGFSQAALDRIFQYEGRPDGTCKPGRGLGLHIAREMALRIGGAITVANRPDGGAIVTLTLPSDSWQSGTSDPETPLPDLSMVKVLLAEDTPSLQSLTAQMLAEMGAEVQIAPDGVAAIDLLDRERFDIALIDIEMPRLSGLDVIRSIRGRDRVHAAMPVVAVTAYVLRSHREAIYGAGADAILSKPFAGIEALGLAIRSALDRRSIRVPDLGAQPASGTQINRDTFFKLLDIAGEDGGVELLDRMCSDLQRTRDALSLALPLSDRTAIRAETHVLIALAGAVGAEGLQHMAEAVNAIAHRRDDVVPASVAEEILRQIDMLVAFSADERARRAGMAA